MCKQGFAELQAGRTLQVNATKLVLQRSYPDFASRVLFTRQRTHPAPSEKVGPGLKKPTATFFKMLKDPDFVLGMVSALEEQGKLFPIADRCHVAALLQVALHDEPSYGFELLTALLDGLLAKSSSKRQPKLVQKLQVKLVMLLRCM